MRSSGMMERVIGAPQAALPNTGRARSRRRAVRTRTANGTSRALWPSRENCMAGKSSARPMSKAQIATHLATKFEMTKKDSAAILEEIAKLAYREAKKGFTLPGIGKLVVVRRKERMGRNPQTGEPIKIPARTVLKFRIAKAAKVAVGTK